jgi:hypothetical protein
VALVAQKTRRAVLACAVATLLVPGADGVELKAETAAGFDHYVHAAEERMAGDLRDGRFLVIDSLPDAARKHAYLQVRQGRLYIEPLHTKENDKTIQAPSGLIHDWVGLAFIPGATLPRTLAVLQDYDNQERIYKPDVRRSKLLEHEANEFKVYVQLYRKSLVTVVVNVNLDIQYSFLGVTQATSRSYATRIAEVEDVGKPDEHELPVGNDHGYIWRLDSYWSVEEKDGGVYVQVESIGLSRTIPWAIAWLVNPLVRSIPRSVLSSLLTETRAAVENATGEPG